MIVSRIRDDGGPVYTVEWAFFIAPGMTMHVIHTIWVYEGSFLHRWLGKRAR